MVCRVELDILTQVPTDILTVKALDNDTQKYNSEVYYSVTIGQDVVTVNPATGVVTLHKRLSEKYKQLSFTISARDGGSPQRTGRTKLTIVIKILSGETFMCSYTLCFELCYWLKSCIQDVPGGNVPDFGRMFLTLKYTDQTQNTYIRS